MTYEFAYFCDRMDIDGHTLHIQILSVRTIPVTDDAIMVVKEEESLCCVTCHSMTDNANINNFENFMTSQHAQHLTLCESVLGLCTSLIQRLGVPK
jgi:hypothetical protein